jgi:predicted RND superfamily exporter protein
MWNKIARFIIQYRLTLILLIGLITIGMGYFASKVQMSYDINRTVPANDPDMMMLEKFRAQFGEDGNIIAVGIKDSSIYEQKNFEAYRVLCRNLKQISGVNEVISLPMMKIILKDAVNSRFYLANIFPEKIRSAKGI